MYLFIKYCMIRVSKKEIAAIKKEFESVAKTGGTITKNEFKQVSSAIKPKTIVDFIKACSIFGCWVNVFGEII